MSDTIERDFRQQPCPVCAKEGTIRIDHKQGTFFCVSCGATAIDPWEPPQVKPQQQTQTATATKKVKQIKNQIQPDPRPPIPSGVGIRDVVEDYFSPYDKDGNPILTPGGKIDRALVSKTYCPKPTEIDTTEFDEVYVANNPMAQFYLRVHRKKFKNRRRYDRDIKRRRGGLSDDSIGGTN